MFVADVLRVRMAMRRGEEALDAGQVTLSQCFRGEHDQGLSAEPAGASASASDLPRDDDVDESDVPRPQGRLSLNPTEEGESSGQRPEPENDDPFAGADRKEQEWLLREIEFRNRRERDGVVGTKRGAVRPNRKQPTIMGFLKTERKEGVE